VGGGPAGGGPGRVGSSTLPHKRNRVGGAAGRAARRRALGQVQVLLAAAAQEHERALGAWPAEWQAISDLLAATAAAVRGTADLLAGLEVDPARMAANLELTDGLINAEAVSGALAPDLGRPRAQKLVEEAARRAVEHGSPFRDELLKTDEIADVLDAEWIDRLLDPAGYLGSADELIDRALRAHAHAAPRENT
jgi:3-carboxy-cis,cis-muconate cycloisomerase